MAAEASRVRAVALVDEDEEVGVVVGFDRVPEGRVELVDERGDEGCAVADECDEVAAAPRADRFQFAGLEGVADLVVQVGAVGDDDDAGVDDFAVEGECAAEHDHGEGFAGALGVPDCAALALVVGAEVFYTLDGVVDGEELLVAGDLADSGVEDGEAADEVEEAVGAAEGMDEVVLGGGGMGGARAAAGECELPLFAAGLLRFPGLAPASHARTSSGCRRWRSGRPCD